jgi:hypothetical protein
MVFEFELEHYMLYIICREEKHVFGDLRKFKSTNYKKD